MSGLIVRPMPEPDWGRAWEERQLGRIERYLRQHGGWVKDDELVDRLRLSRREVLELVQLLEDRGTLAIDPHRPILPPPVLPDCPYDGYLRNMVRGLYVVIRPESSRGSPVEREDVREDEDDED